MRAEIILPSDGRWTGALAGAAHDLYHLPGYAILDARREGLMPVAVLVESDDGSFLQPLIIRPLPDGLGADYSGMTDAVSPYGYSGPVISAGADPAFVRDAVASMIERLRSEGVITAFVRLHPLHDYPQPTLAGVGSMFEHGPTVWIDLTASDENLWGQIRPRVRTYVNRMRREGYEARVESEWDSLDEFFALYTQTMERVEADAAYFFDRAYFEDLRDELGDQVCLAVVRVGGELACAGLFSEVAGVVEYHLGGTAERYRKLGPTRLLFHHMTGWAKARGNRILHLGGGVGAAEDSLFHFKAGFSPHRAVFTTWRVVVDAEAVAAVTGHSESGGQADDHYFPPYRAPAKTNDGST